MSIPVVKDITEAFVRATFFAQASSYHIAPSEFDGLILFVFFYPMPQFVGGDTAHDVVPLLEQLRAENKGVLFAYSVEVDESEASSGKATPVQQHHPPSQQPVHKEIVDKLIGSIDVAADFEDKYAHTHGTTSGRKTWVAIKLVSKIGDNVMLTVLNLFLCNLSVSLGFMTI
jgi:proline dehydrogenase